MSAPTSTPAVAHASATPPVTAIRWFVLGTLVLLNFAVWLDELKFTQLSPYWSGHLGLDAAGTAPILSAYYVGYAPALLIAGFLADRFGPRLLLLIAGFGVTALSVSMVFVNTAGEMYVRNVVFGIFFGLVWAPSNRMIANWFPLHERTKATSIWLSASNAAGIVTPLIALPIAAAISWQAAFVIVALVGVPAVIALFWVRNNPVGYVASPADRLTLRGTGAILRIPSVWLMIGAAFLAGAFSLTIAWAGYGIIGLAGADPNVVAVVSPLVSLVPFAFAYLNGPVLLKVFRGRTNLYMASGLAFAALGFLLAATLDVGWEIWLILVVVPMGMANAVFYGTLTAYWSALVGPRATGTATGLVTAAQIVCSLVLIAASGGWFDLGATGLAQLAPVFLIGAALLAVGAVLVLLARRITVTSASSLPAGH